MCRGSEKRSARISTVQNPYSLLNRKDEIGLTEVLHREQVGYLPYSPLGMGVLTGKYLKGKPSGSRLALFSQYDRYSGKKAEEATAKYVEIAEKHGLQPAQMALAFVDRQAFVTSNIIGATNLEQLRENLESIDVQLSEEVVKEIQQVHRNNPNPAP